MAEKKKFERKKPHANVGTIGHVDHGKTKTFKLGNKNQEHNLIDALKIACRKFTKEKTGKKPFTNINLVKI